MLALIEIELRFEPSIEVIRFILGSPSRIVEKCAQIIIAAEVFWPFFPAFTVLPFGIIRSFSFGGWCPFADCVKRKIANRTLSKIVGVTCRLANSNPVHLYAFLLAFFLVLQDRRSGSLEGCRFPRRRRRLLCGRIPRRGSETMPCERHQLN